VYVHIANLNRVCRCVGACTHVRNVDVYVRIQCVFSYTYAYDAYIHTNTLKRSFSHYVCVCVLHACDVDVYVCIQCVFSYLNGELEALLVAHAPYARAHRQQIVVCKATRIVVFLQVLPQVHFFVGRVVKYLHIYTQTMIHVYKSALMPVQRSNI
jgi:hypothetical protein